MCGIAGIIAFNNPDIDLAGIALRMNDSIRHRGPDGEGYLVIGEDDEVPLYGKDTPGDIIHSSILHKPVANLQNRAGVKGILAHRRLSIIDITATGHQPVCNISKTLWIVFNGELYNYIELRDELAQKGHQFHTSSDTEIALAAYAEWGCECVNHFNGMWAFVIYDKQKKQIFASRDRFGVKPFYYVKNDDLFCFASEQKALLKAGVVDFVPNEKAVFEYWVLGSTEAEEEGMFKGIYELFPAHSLTVDLRTGELKKWKYYTLPYSSEFDAKELDMQLCIDKVLVHTLEAVWLRLRSDVEVGCCLSGGLDSSSIVSSIYNLREADKEKKHETAKMLSSGQRPAGNPISTFTAGFDNPLVDESSWAKIVSGHTQSNAHYAKPDSKGLLKDLEDLIYCQDIPIWSTSTYSQFRVMRLVKENGIKVVLTGQGGDELFAGYDKYYSYHFADMERHGQPSVAEAMLTGRAKQLQKLSMRQAILNKYIYYLPVSLQLKFRLKIHPELKYLNRDFLKRNNKRLQNKKNVRTLNEALNKDFNNALLKTYLKCEDRCSMWHSVESRTPFADDINLIEYIFSLPSSVKIMNGELKWLLRKAMQGIVPDAIINRKDKMGYVTPNRQWIAEIRNDVKHLFENPALAEYLDTKSILRDYDLLFNQPDKPDDGRIFKLIAFAKWMEVFGKI